MGRVIIREFKDGATNEVTACEDFSVGPGVKSQALIAGADRPLSVWHHSVPAGVAMTWRQPAEGHVIYVQEGAAYVDDLPLEKKGAMIVEPGGSAVLRAGDRPLRLLHFYRNDPKAPPHRKRGGHVHVVNNGDAKRYGDADFEGAHADIVMYADATCPTCDLWLHRAEMTEPFPGSPAHQHTEDEIIAITNGVLTLGNRKIPEMTAIAVDAETTYKFGLGSERMGFVNFRACDPFLVMVNKEGKSDPISERILLEGMH